MMEKKYLTREACFALLKEYETPPHVVRHCIAVTVTALKIAGALNQQGHHLDLDLIQGAGLIHDIARVEEEHWVKGAEIALKMGYPREAHIIENHMFYDEFSDITRINETDIICLADRLVKEDQYVGLDQRIKYVIEKVRRQGKPDAEAHILERKKDAQRLIDQIEHLTGKSLDELMQEEEIIEKGLMQDGN